LILSCLLIFALIQTPSARLPDRVSVTEFTLRKYAVKVVMPDFPSPSLKKKNEGVAVFQILVDKEGSVTSVNRLEAPDDWIARAVERILSKWKFKAPTIGGHPVPISGKLTFYFVIENGKGIVRNPKPFRQ
jgi:TonB family protein